MTTETLPNNDLLKRLEELKARGIEPFRMSVGKTNGEWVLQYTEQPAQTPQGGREAEKSLPIQFPLFENGTIRRCKKESGSDDWPKDSA